jgi:hypothetical protein
VTSSRISVRTTATAEPSPYFGGGEKAVTYE